MAPVSFDALSKFACACRRGLESLAGKQGSRFENFPRGACGDSAELIGRLLHEEFGLEGTYVCGWDHEDMKPSQSHAWFEAGGHIFDLTYDQDPGSVIAGWVLPLDSPWHQKFRTQERRNGFCMPTGWPAYPYEAYAAIQQALIAR